MLRVVDELWTCHLGRIEYREAVALQERLRARVQDGELPDLLLLLEHPPVYTLGRRSEPGELPIGGRGIDVVETERGGKLTYHGPGQLVGYPIMHVPNVRRFVETMETALVDALREAGVPAGTREGREYTGVWVGDRKIASIGIHLSRRVSMHGFAVNVDDDLAPFDFVVACGLPGVRMTSMRAEGAVEGVACFRKRAGHAFARAFGRRQRLVTPRRLGAHEGDGVRLTRTSELVRAP
jgi:lipoate-protein ligase B